MTIHMARPRSGLVADEGVCVSGDVPDSRLAEMERAQAALRDGIERARQVLRKAKLEIGALHAARAEKPGFRLARVEFDPPA
jgi:hypothetical protein